MKTNLIRVLSAVSLLGAAAGAFAQSSAALRVTVPFEFNVNGQKMAAGDYSVDEQSGNGVVSLYNFTTKQTALVLTEPGSPRPSNASPSLTFEKRDSGVVLVRVFAPASGSRLFPSAQILK